MTKMADFRLRHILGFVGQLWLQSFKRAVWVAVIGIIVACLRVTFSQSGEGSGLLPDMNSTNTSAVLAASCLDMEKQCSELPAVCHDCDYNETCTYGEDTNITCTALPGAECEVSLKNVCSCPIFHPYPF